MLPPGALIQQSTALKFSSSDLASSRWTCSLAVLSSEPVVCVRAHEDQNLARILVLQRRSRPAVKEEVLVLFSSVATRCCGRSGGGAASSACGIVAPFLQPVDTRDGTRRP